MTDFAVLGITAALIAGLALSIYHFWRNRDLCRGFLIFLLPILGYFLWHFAVEAYNWGEIWSTALEQTLELNIAVALVDLKLIATIFMLLFWIFVWNSVNCCANGRKSRGPKQKG